MCDISYGTTALLPFLPFLPGHQEHMDLIKPTYEGFRIGPVFDCIVKEVTINILKAFFVGGYL